MTMVDLKEWFELFEKAGISSVDVGKNKINTALAYAINFDSERISFESLEEMTTDQFR